MKRMIAILLCLVMMFSLCGCSLAGSGASQFGQLLSIFRAFDFGGANLFGSADITFRNNGSADVSIPLPDSIHLAGYSELNY